MSALTGPDGDLEKDVAYSPAEDLLYSVSEHPSVRWLFTMRRSSFD